MSPRPFYKWKRFWLGLFVLAFLGWAWVVTMKTGGEFRLSAGPGRNTLAMTLEPGVVRIWCGKDGSTQYVTFDYYISRWSGGDEWLNSSVTFDEWIPGCPTVSVSWCWICSGALLAWMCCLLWHGKRERMRRLPS